MNSDAYDDPKVEAAWLTEQRTHAEEYLREQRVPFGRVADRPAWHLAPYIALWPVLGPRTGEIHYWVIVGDLPADFLSADAAAQPRRAIASFAEQWVGLAGFNTVRAPSIRRLGGRSGWVRPLERRSCSSLARLAS